MSRSQGSVGRDQRLALELIRADARRTAAQLVAVRWPERTVEAAAAALQSRRWYLLAAQRSRPHV